MRRFPGARPGGWWTSALALVLAALPSLALAQTPGRVLSRAEIEVYGLMLRVSPETQTVPKDYATIVSAYLQVPEGSDPASVPAFAPGAEVHATLRGPGLASPRALVTPLGTPFDIPALNRAGTYTLDDIRLVVNGEVLLYGVPDRARLDVIDQLLVTSVTARPLTADEIREKGIVFDRSSFQAYDFTAAFAIEDGSLIDIRFPVVLPTLLAYDAETRLNLLDVDVPQLRTVQTLIPDTLKIQARIPNLSVVGFTLRLDETAESQSLVMPAIPGVIVIPGDIGFLNQFFSVTLMVGNVAPEGSSLAVRDLRATISLPAGIDRVVGSADDPLRLATTAAGVQAERPVLQAGPDGKVGTADDILVLGPGQTGTAEFLVEGLREGTHVIEMELAGTLDGLPIGPAPVRGRAAGAVLVRNPAFTLTFTHPDVVNAGEPYTLDVTVTNTSNAPANFISLNLFGSNVSGATLTSDPSQAIEHLAPGDSATVTYGLVAQRTGTVTAATLDSHENVSGRFLFKTGIGEFGVPLSPDSLVLPQEANGLPAALREATVGLLGRAWAVATAPVAAIPPDLTRFSKQVVLDRGVQAATTGLRISLGEPAARAVADLWLDVLGNEFTQLSSRVPAGDTSGLLALLERDVNGFDLVRRRSFRGARFGEVVGDLIGAGESIGAPWHAALASQFTSRPGHVSVLLSGPGAAHVDGVLVDPAGLRTGRGDDGTTLLEIPSADAIVLRDGSGIVVGRLFAVAVPQAGTYDLRLSRAAGAAADEAVDVSIVVPTTTGQLRFAATTGVLPGEIVEPDAAADVTTRVRVIGASGAATRAVTWTPVADPPPTVVAVRQIASADLTGCSGAEFPGRQYSTGRVIAVLFSEQVTPESVQDGLSAGITAFEVGGTRVTGVALQPGRRMAYLALREGIGPFEPRSLTVVDVRDATGQSTGTVQVPIEITVGNEAGVVFGQVRNAEGQALPFTTVRLFYEFQCGGQPTVSGVLEDIADAEGRYQFDYVLTAPQALRIVALDPESGDTRRLAFSLARAGQRMQADLVFVGRGTIVGRTLAEDGVTPLANTQLRITSLTDQSQYGGQSDATGAFALSRLPVGNLLIEAVNVARGARVFLSATIPFAGSTTTRDIVLLDVREAPPVGLGRVTGRVVRADGVTAAPGLPVVAYYQNGSKPGVKCPNPPGQYEPSECAVASTTSDSDGRFDFPGVPAGTLRLDTFDNGGLQQGGVRVSLQTTAEQQVTILLGGGFGTVRGVVVDASGVPVTDAVVGGGLSLVTVNPADGTFTLPDVPVGRREIVAVSESIRGEGRMTIDLPLAGDEVFARVVLSATGAVAGVVRDRTGVPQAGANVWVFRDCFNDDQEESICVLGETQTDAAGAYRINGLGVGTYHLSAFRPDRRDGNILTFAIRFDRQTVIADVTYRGGTGTVTGRVLRAEQCDTPPCADTPLPARVGISGDRLVMAGGVIPVRFEWVQNFAIRDNDPGTGAFTFTNVFVGPFTVRAAGLFSPEPVAGDGVITAPGATAEVDLRLQATSRVTGVVLEPDGVEPVRSRQIALKFQSNATIVVCTEDKTTGESECKTLPQGIQEAFATTDTDGRFSFPIVNPGPFTITATDAALGRTATLRGNVRPGETADMQVRLLGRGAVTVRVLPASGSTPVAGASVEVRSLSRPDLVRQGLAVNGTITFGGADALDEGAIVVMAMGPGGFAGRASAVVPATDAPVSVDVYIDDATGTVTGVVTRVDDTGLPAVVSNAEVVLLRDGRPIAFAVTGGDGRYEAPLVPPGAIAVDAFDPVTAGRGRASGLVLPGTVDTAIDVSLDALGLIRGVVIDAATRAPLRGWHVSLRQVTASGRAMPEQMTQAGVDGTFSFPGAAIGSFTLRASTPGVVVNGTASGVVTRGGQLVDVPLAVSILREVTGRVEGRVTSVTGAAAPNAQVTVCPTGKACLPTVADGDGRFSVDGVALGRVLVNAQAQVTGGTSLGQSGGTLLFEGDTLNVAVSLVDVSIVEGTVYQMVNNNRVPAAGATVRLNSQPSDGCPWGCQQSADQDGRFRFTNVAARTFTLTATTGSGQVGSTGGAIDAPGTVSGIEMVVAPSVTVSGRAVLPDGTPAAGVVAELTRQGQRLFDETDADGHFAFDGISLGAYTVALEDPIGGGLARRTGTLATLTPLDLGNLELDTAPPGVAETTPGSGAIGVSRTPTIDITFSERIATASVTADSVSLVGPDGPVTTTQTFADTDRVVRLSLLPGSQLRDETRYAIRVREVRDLVGRVMPAEFVGTFTTVDITPPSVSQASPAANSSGVSLVSVVRVTFSEAVDPQKFTGPAIVLSTSAGPVAGRVDFAFGNTVAVFSPAQPLLEDQVYTVQVAAATDLVGQQGAPFTYSFATTDRTPPVVTALVPSSPTVIQGSTVDVAAITAPADVALVDFYVNGTLVYTDRFAPFSLSLQATSAFGAPGSTMTIAAFAIDTSGNRSVAPAQTTVTIVADGAPSLTLAPLAPSVVPGQRLQVALTASDDVGIASTFLRARMSPAGGGSIRGLLNETRTVAPPVTPRADTFEVVIPTDAVAGNLVTIEASTTDTGGQVTTNPVVTLTVADTQGPSLTVTGVTAGQRISAGQTLSVLVSADDPAGVARIGIKTTGVIARTDERQVTPPLPSAATTFTLVVPSTVSTGDSLTIEAFALDTADNRTTAAQLTLLVGDAQAPTVTLFTVGGSLDVTPGVPVTVRVQGTDDAAIGQLRLTGTGPLGYAFDESRSTAPVSPATADFTVPVPATMADGETIVLTARATDTTGNVSSPATLTLTARGLTTVTLPASLLVRAGFDETFPVSLGSPAPAGGLTVTFVARTAGRVLVPAPLTFAPGATTANATLRGVAGGVTQIDASISGVVRQSMTVTVVGGVVHGTVLTAVDGVPGLQPVAGSQVTVFHAGPALVTTTDALGQFDVAGVIGLAFSVRAGEVGLLGYVAGSLDVAGGSAEATVVLVPAGAFTGTLLQPDGVTPVGANVEVTLAEAATPAIVAQRVRTDEEGRWRFELVAPGPYVIDAADLAGNRARASATAAAGVESNVALVYLGRGSVTGLVRTAVGQPVPGATVELFASSLFGAAPTRTTHSAEDGRYAFADVFVGTVTVRARDALNQGGVGTGAIAAHGQQIEVPVTLAAFGTLEGTVYRQDGVTPVPGASVTVRMTGGAQFTVSTQPDGTYRFDILPFEGFSITVRDTGTRGLGIANGGFSSSGETLTRDVQLLPQGTVLVQVLGADGEPVNGATVNVSTTGYGLQDSRQGATSVVDGIAGRVLLDRLLEGTLTVDAFAGGLSGRVTGVLLARDVVTNVQVALEPQATIAGRILEADGVTPAAGTVIVYGANNFQRQLTTTGGHFSTDLRLGTYDLVAFDTTGRRRAIAYNVALTANAQVETRDMLFVAVGTVSGRVLHPTEGGAVSNLTVQLQSLHPEFGGFRSATTNAAGLYSIADVPYGAVRVSVAKPAESLQGESSGLLQAPVLSLDILLQNNSVTLPVTLNDVNDSTYTVAPGGGLAGGTRGVFSSGATQLELDLAGVRQPFAGTTFATRELGGRQFVVRQQGLQGLTVTRKVFVPVSGYFSRHLEILTNPTEAPITVGVHLTSKLSGRSNGFGAYIHYFVGTTSSGDATLNPGVDRWVTLDGSGVDGYYQSGGSSRLALVFDGENAAESADVLEHAQGQFNSFEPGTFSLGWESITVPAGGQVALLHFVGQQPTAPAATAAASRLASLPPEALDGLTSAELASVVNFALPADGLSQVPALPPVTGQVSGRVLEGDGTTPVSGAQVRFRSESPVHARDWFVTSAADGSFSFNGVPQRPVPVTGFVLDARHPLNTTSVVSPLVTTTFPDGTSVAAADVPFSNTGVVRARVTSNGIPVVGASVELASYATRQTNATGEAEFRGVPAALEITFRGTVSHTQGSSLTILPVTTTIAAGATSTVDLVVEPTGAVTGLLTNAAGVAQPNRQVILYGGTSGTSFTRSTMTDSAGRFVLTDVRAGTARVRATDPASNFTTEVVTTVLQGQATDIVVRYIGNGTITTTVTRANGTPIAGMRVQVTVASFSRPFVETDANGVAVVTDIPLDQAATIRAYHPSNQAIQRSVVRTLTPASGGQASLSIALPAFGQVTGLVRTTAGALTGAGVRVLLTGSGAAVLGATYSQTISSDSRYSFGPVPAATPFTVDTEHPTKSRSGFTAPRSRTTPQAITTDGQVLAVDTFLPSVVSTMRVHVRETSGAAVQGARVQVRDGLVTFFEPRGSTNAAGDLDVPFVVEPVADVRILRGATGNTIHEMQAVSITRDMDGQTIDVTVVVRAFTVTLRGRIYQADGVTLLPLPNAIELRRPDDGSTLANSACVSIFCATPGQFEVSNLPLTGGGVLLRAIAPFGGDTVGTYDKLVVPTADGVIDVAFTLPFVQTSFTGRVLANDGVTPVTTGTVSPRSLNDLAGVAGNPVTAAGEYTLSPAYLPTAGVLLRYTGPGLPNTGYAVDTGPLPATPGQVIVRDITLPPSVYTTITGRILVGDGVTPLEEASARVSWLDGPCVGSSCSVNAGVDGRFSLPVLLPESGEATLTASAWVSGSPVETREIVQLTQGAVTDVGDIVLPISLIRGRVTFGTNVPAPDVEVFARRESGQITWASGDDQGSYRLIGLKAGTYTLVATQYPSGLTVEREVVLPADDAVLDVDLQLPEVASIDVRLLKNGMEFDDVDVALRGPAGVDMSCAEGYDVYPHEGVCRFAYVPLGTYYVQGRSRDVCEEMYDEENDEYVEVCTPGQYASGTATLTEGGTTAQVDLVFDLQPSVRLDFSQGYLAEGTRVRITAISTMHGGPLGTPSSVFETTLPMEREVLAGPLPVGPATVLVEYMDGPYWHPYARVEIVVAPWTPPSGWMRVLVVPGNAGGEYAGLYGADRYYYGAGPAGNLTTGAYLPGSTLEQQGGITFAGVLSVDSQEMRGWTASGRSGRQVTFGPLQTGSPVVVTRRLEVPEAGGYLYALDTFTNPTTVDLTIEVMVRNEMRSHAIAASSTVSAADAGLLVYDSSALVPAQVSVGLLYAGIDAPVAPAVALNQYDGEVDGNHRPSFTYRLTIAAGQSLSLLSFTAVDAPDNSAGIDARLRAIAASPATAASGLTPQERARVVNFRLEP